MIAAHVWHLGVGDPDWISWAIVGGYLLATFFSIGATRGVPRTARFRERIAWPAIGIAMFALALNKQLDLQKLLTDFGRDWAMAGGWYGERRLVQRDFIYIFFACVGAGWVGLWLAYRRSRHWLRAALLGLGLLGAFILLRAALFHHVGGYFHYTTAGLRLHQWLERIGVVAVALAAWRQRRDTLAGRIGERR